MGIGAAMVNTTGIAIVFSLYPANKRGLAIGIVTAAIYSGLSAGPFLGGVLTGFLGWRWIFFIAAPFEIIPLVLTLLFVKEEWADKKGEKQVLLTEIMIKASDEPKKPEMVEYSYTIKVYSPGFLPEEIKNFRPVKSRQIVFVKLKKHFF